jgi:hypothetical protein
MGYNATKCGNGYANWWFQAIGMMMKGNETYQIFPNAPIAPPNGTCDIGGFDFDLGTSYGMMEFNYAHEIWGPTFGVFGRATGAFQAGANTQAYNIFENGGMGFRDGSSGNGLPAGVPGGSLVGPSTDVAGPLAYYNNTHWNGYNGTTDITTTGGVVHTAVFGYGLVCSIKPGWENIVANNLSVAATYSGTDADMVTGVFQPNCTNYTYRTNDWYALAGNAVFSHVLNSSTFTGVPAWNAASGDTGQTVGQNGVNPNFAGTGGAGTTCYAGTGIPSNPGAAGCPGNYKLQTGNTLISQGTDLTLSPHNLTLPPTDYFMSAIPNGHGTGYNYGADGAFH